MILLATVAAGLALLSIQIAHRELKIFAEKFDGLDNAAQVFPHPNETPRPFQSRN
jgi:hypothetical protein